MTTSLDATVAACSCLLGGVCLSVTLAAAPQEPSNDLPVSVDRIREELAKTRPTRLQLDVPFETPVATFRTTVEQRVYVLSLEEWIHEEFNLTPLARQSADWATYRGGYVLAIGPYAVRLDPLLDRMEKSLQRRNVRKIREQIARELAELEAAGKKAGLQDAR